MNSENWQSQVDELQALEAIYENDFSVQEVSGVLLRASSSVGESSEIDAINAAALAAAPEPVGEWSLECRISIHITLPEEGCEVCLGPPHALNQQQDKGEEREEESKEEEEDSLSSTASAVYRLHHLPPISLDVTCGPQYPSESPPEYQIAAMWLSKSQSAELKAHLMSLWEEQGVGLPVIYTWAEWLQTSALHHLKPQNEGPLQLGEEHKGDKTTQEQSLVPGSTDGGSSSGSSSEDHEGGSGGSSISETRLLSLLQYSAARELQIFQSGMHTCAICFEEKQGTCFVRLDCGHSSFCAECLRQQARVQVESGALDALTCPHTSCRAPLDSYILRRLLEPDVYDKWEQLTLQRALETMPDAAYCPRCGMLSLEDLSDNCADCPKCFYIFCTLCNEARHPGVQCVSAETRLAMLRNKAEGGGAAAVAELRRREHEFLSLAMIEKTSKRCPSCGMAVQRSEGCNKMACANCGAFFCWRCNKQISGYDHFKAGGSCVLFDEAEILRWERRWEEEVGFHQAAAFRNDYFAEQAAAAADVPGGHGREERRNRPVPMPSVNCPNCGQLSYKLYGNNHIQCWSCTRHYCALCRTVLQRRGGGAHFGPGGCKQHS